MLRSFCGQVLVHGRDRPHRADLPVICDGRVGCVHFLDVISNLLIFVLYPLFPRTSVFCYISSVLFGGR